MNATVKDYLTVPTPEDSSVVALARQLDSRLNAVAGYEANQLQGWLRELLQRGRVAVGWRESCGKTDPTARIYREWLKVIKSLRKSGYLVKEESEKHKNSWATKAGGFWNSVIYSLPIRAHEEMK